MKFLPVSKKSEPTPEQVLRTMLRALEASVVTWQRTAESLEAAAADVTANPEHCRSELKRLAAMLQEGAASSLETAVTARRVVDHVTRKPVH